MGLWQNLRKLLRRRTEAEAIESRFKSDQSMIQSIESINQSPINQSITEPVGEKPVPKALPETPELSQPVELQKESLELGVAAGYTGRAIKEIESSLNRIESHMVTRDWFDSKFEDRTPELIEIMKKHEENQQKRLESIEDLLKSLQKTAEKAPEPLKTELFTQIKAVEGQLPLTSKMQKLVAAVKEYGELSYTDLANKLSITEDALRGLLSNTIRRTDEIQRFKKDGKGWVRFVVAADSITNQSEESINQSNESL